MTRLSTLLKSAAIAGVAAFAATAATAQDITVYVYEKGYFPNVVYYDVATRIKLVNKTEYTVGIDTDPNGAILVRRIYKDQVAYINISDINNRSIRTPYLYGTGRYQGDQLNVIAGPAPDS